MRTRHEFSLKVKTAASIRAAGSCEECGRRLFTGDWHYDHDIPDALGGEPTIQNCRVLCRSCHVVKTTKADIPRIAKANRNYRKAHNIRKQSRFPCARTSPWKKKVDGNIVRR